MEWGIDKETRLPCLAEGPVKELFVLMTWEEILMFVDGCGNLIGSFSRRDVYERKVCFSLQREHFAGDPPPLTFMILGTFGDGGYQVICRKVDREDRKNPLVDKFLEFVEKNDLWAVQVERLTLIQVVIEKNLSHFPVAAAATS